MDNNRYAALDGLRGLAILLVFNFHFFNDYHNQSIDGSISDLIIETLAFGHIGVDLFFTISGFLIYNSIIRTRKNLYQFLANRYKRLLPPALILIIPFLANHFTLKNLFDNLSLLKLFPDSQYAEGVLWSLSFEIHFYIIISVVIYLSSLYLKKDSLIILIILWLFGLGWFGLQWNTSIRAHFEVTRVLAFFFGLTVAWFNNKGYLGAISNKATQTTAICLFIVCTVYTIYWGTFEHWRTAGSSIWLQNLFYIFTDILFALVLSLVIIENDNFVKKIFKLKILQGLGIISYSLYLFHTSIGIPLGNNMIEQIFKIDNGYVNVVLHYTFGIGISSICAYFFYYYLERPYYQQKHNVLTDQDVQHN